MCRKLGCNYVFIPEGNKTFSFYWTAKYWLAPSFKYIMMVDDDVCIPPNIDVPLNRFLADPQVAAIAYTIRSACDTTNAAGDPKR